MGSFTIMKTHLLFAILLIVVLLASCSGKRYGHYAYVKRKVLNVEIPQKAKKKFEQTITVASIQPVEEVRGGSFTDVVRDTIALEKNTQVYRRAKKSKNYRLRDEEKPVILIKSDNKLAVNDTIVKNTFTIRNYEAGASMTLGIIALFFALFALVFTPLIFVAFAFGLGAFALAKEARNEIKRRPELYSNKDEATIGYVIGWIFWVISMAAVVLLILFFLLLIVLIAIAIIGFIMTY